MNSKQRRQARREFPYEVQVKAEDSERYYYHDRKVMQAQTWCRKQFGRDNFRSKAEWNHAVFKFIREKDATYFMLKWA